VLSGRLRTLQGMQFQNQLFTLMLATLFTHELDAMTQSEWRLLYVLRGLPDDTARFWFVAIHVPLFWALMALSGHRSMVVRQRVRSGIAAFCVVHAGLHIYLRNDPLNTFNSTLSWSLILVAAFLGALHLMMALKSHGRASVAPTP
jgi:hypothetical protein